MIELSSVSKFIVEFSDGAHPLSLSGDLSQHEITVSAIKSVGAAMIEVNDFIDRVRSQPVGIVGSILLFDQSGAFCDEWPAPPLPPSHDDEIWRFMVIWLEGVGETAQKSTFFTANAHLGFPTADRSRSDAVHFAGWVERQGGVVSALWGHDGKNWVKLGRDGFVVSPFRLPHLSPQTT